MTAQEAGDPKQGSKDQLMSQRELHQGDAAKPAPVAHDAPSSELDRDLHELRIDDDGIQSILSSVPELSGNEELKEMALVRVSAWFWAEAEAEDEGLDI